MLNLSDLQDIEAERAILRLLIQKIDLMAEINDLLDTKDFYGLAHQTIFTALKEMFEKNINVDMVTLADYLTTSGRMENAGSVAYITFLCKESVNVGGMGSYIDIIKDNSRRQKIALCCDEAGKRIHDKTTSLEEMSNIIADTLEKVQPVKKVDKQKPLVNAYETFITDTPQGINTGYEEIDYPLQGMKKGNLIILAARPAMGKTTLALNIIANLCQEGKSVIFYSLEMTAEEIYKKLISCTSKISIAEARRQLAKDNQTKNNTFDDNVVKSRNKESEAFWKRLQNGLDTVYKWNLEIIDKGSFEISDLKIASKVWKKKGGLDLLVIDYLQLMTARGHENRTAEVTAITKGLKDLAKSLDIPVLALAQLNREVEGRQNKKPTKADLRESGSIEQDADVVMLIYRDRYYNKNGDPWTEVIIDKNRVGENSTARLEFYPAISKFYEYKGFAGQTVRRKEIEGVFK